MSDLDDILWAMQRQSRALQDVIADARLVWRDSNARTAEQRFLQPHTETEGKILTAVGAQHRGLNSATADVLRAEEQHRVAAQESAQVTQCCEAASQSAQAAFSEANSATAQAAKADSLSAEARSYIAQAAAAGGG